MSTVVAIVKSIVGQVIATSAEGVHRVLVEGDRLFVGDTLDTGAGGAVTLELADGRTLDLGRDTQWSSADAANATTTQSVADAQSEVLDVQRAIAAGADPTQDLAPTAAGPGAGGAGGGAAGGSHSFVLLTETAGEVQPEIGIAFTDPAGGDAIVQEQAIGQEPNVAPVFTGADGNDASATINVTTDEDVPLTGTFTARDGNGDALTYSLVGTGVSHGSLTLTPQGVWTYTPDANYNGPDSFQVVVSDGRGGTDTLTVNIGVNPVNDAPVADPASATAIEDGAVVSGQLTASDVDAGDTQAYSVRTGTTAPAGFTLNSDGSWSFDPSNAAYQSLGAGQEQTLSIQFTVTDSGGLTSNNTLTIVVTGVNDAPTVTSTVDVTTDEDQSGFTVNLLTGAGASDVDQGDSISATDITLVGKGDTSGVIINADGTLSVDPSAYNYLSKGESITLTYSYNVVDQNGGVTPNTATITIDGVNDAPVVSSAVTAGFSEDAAPQTINLLQHASDVDQSDTLSVSNLQETNGRDTSGVTLNADGTLSVNPNAYNYLAAGQTLVLNYTYDVIDSQGGVTPTSATITITGQNDAPVAVADTASGNEDTVITGNVLTNDSDPDAGASLSVSKFSFSIGPVTFTANAGQTLNLAVGKLTIAANGDFTFTPVANYNGPVPTVTYTLSDGTASTTSTLNITVNPVNDAPFITAPNSVQVTNEDTSKVFSSIRGNAITTGDIDSSNLTTTLNVEHGTLNLGPVALGLTISGNGTGTLVISGNQAAINLALQGLTYKPTADYNGTDVLKISSTDGSLTSNTSVAIRVDAVADIRADNVSVNEDNVLTFNAITGVGGGTADTFSNPDRAITGVTQGAHGSVTFNADGTLVYTPDANYYGTDTFTYTVTSGGVTETATVTVNVISVNDAAVLSSANIQVNEIDTPITTGGQLTISDIDSPETFVAQTNTLGGHGTFSINAQGVWTYVAASAYNELNVGQSVSDTFDVYAADGTKTTVTVTINGTNDAPVANSVTATGSEDPSAPIAVTLTGSDVDGTVTGYQLESLPANGTLYLDAAGTIAAAVGDVVSGQLYFVPNADWNGTTTFDFHAIDNSNTSSATSTASITVTPVPDAPTVTIVTDADNDGTLTNTELGNSPTVSVSVGLPNDAVAGNTVTVTSNGVPQVITLTPADISNGSVLVDVPRPADGVTLNVSATITDGNGLTSPSASDSAVVGDTTATAAPTVVISTDANNDGTLSNTELGNATTVAVHVGIPSDAVAGDKLTITSSTGNIQIITLTDTLIASGIDLNYPRPADGTSLSVEATITDAAGNTSQPGSDSATVGDTVATAAPIVVISTDTNNDGTLSNTELGNSTTVAVKITLPGDAKVGDVLNITNPDGTVTPHSITASDLSNGVNLTYPRPADGVAISVSATITDAANNTSAPGSDSATVGDTTATPAPVVTITTDNNNDGVISTAELNGVRAIHTQIDVPAGAVIGDTLKITINGQPAFTFTVSQYMLDHGVSMTTSGPGLVDGYQYSVTATLTDMAGNVSAPGSDAAVIGDTTATAAPTVVISTDTNNDGTLSNTELGNSTTVAVKITLPGDAKVGDVLNITNPDGSVSQHTITAGDLTNGVDLSYARPADGSSLSVSATITDAAGNISAPGSDSATVGDTTATAAPTVVISTDANNDGTLSNTELGTSTTVAVKITLPGDANVGDVLNITNPDGSVTQHTITAGDISNGVDLSYPRPADGVAINVSATITDAAGNTSAPGSDSATVGDTTATAAPTVVISTDTNNDGTLSNTELGTSTTVAVKVTIPTGAVVGDTLTVTANGGTPQSITLTADQIANGIDLTYPRPADGSAINVSATITDAAGNTSAPGSDSATVGDTTATAAPTVVISTDTNNDGTLSNTELGTSTTVAVKITLPGDANVGDVLNITNPDGSVTQHTITAGDISNGVDLSYPRPADGVAINVSATITDAAGNTSAPGSDSATVGDTTATAAPTVVISTDTNNDGTLSNTELGTSTTVAVKVTIPTGAVVGDTLTVTANGGTPQSITLTADQIANGVDLTYPRPADGSAINVSATITDAAGNVSQPGSDSATVGDTTATAAPTVVISTDTNNDGTLSNTELGTSTTVAVKVTIPTGAVVGDTLTVTANGGTPQTITLTADQIANGVDLTYPRPADGGSLSVSATITDAAGNVSQPGSDSATVGDTTATAAPTVVISTDANNDGTLSGSELGSSTTVAVKVTLPAGATVGDTLNITNPDGSVTQHTVTAGDIANGLDLTYARPADGGSISVSATLTDVAGNTSLPGSDSATVGDTTAASAPVVTIVDDADNNAQLTAAEIGNDGVQITVAVNNADLVAGGTVSLSINNGGVTHVANLALDNGVLVNAGTTTPATGYTYNNGTISFTESKPATGGSISVTATQSDIAGNVSQPGSDSAVVVNTNPDAIDDPVGTAYTVSLGDKAGALSTNNWGALDSKGLGVSVSAVKGDGTAGTVYSGNDDGNANTLGVAGTPRASGAVANQLEYDPATKTSEGLVLNLNGNINHAEFSVSHLIASEAGGEVGRWVAMYNGSVVATGEFKLTSGGAGTFSIDTGALVFDSIRFEAVNTVTGGGDGSDYFLTGFSGSGPASANGAYTVSEKGTLTIADGSKDLTANDVDADNDTLVVTQVNGQAIGNGAITLTSGALVTVNADGSFSYDTNGKFNALKAGEVATDTFTYTISDGHGGTDTATATVTIIGTNDAPVVTSSAAAAEGAVTESGVTAAGVATAGTASATGTLTATDVDHGSSTSWSVANGTGTYGSLTLTAAGVWTYNLNNSSAATQALKAGEVKTETFTATVSDGQGGTATQVITVTVNGTNDAPVITSAASAAAGSVTEAGVGTAGTATATGTLTATDVDSSSLSWSVPNSGAGTYGSLSINANGVWTYTLDNNSAATQALKAGESKTETFTATVSDGAGGTATQVITVTVNGTNDAPVITSAASAAAGSVTEAGVGTAGTATATGTLTATDVDSTSLSWSVPNSGAGTYGSLSINANGVWTYTLDNNSAATQALKAGEVKTETFTATVSDGAGGTATQVITVTVNGTNDAPVVTSNAAAAAGSVTEAGITPAGAATAGTATATGTLTATDVDSPSTSWSVANGTGTYGSLTLNANGAWTYTLDNNSAATQALKAGEVKTETFTATVSDGQGGTATQVITVTVNGTNDAPVITSAASAAAGSVTEAGVGTAGTATATGTLTATDVDSTSLSWSVPNSGAGTYGSLSINANGVWTYTLDNNSAATQALKAGESKTETFTATVSDGAGGTATQVITVTVNGTNDAPVVTSNAAAAAGSVTEAGVGTNGTPSATGTLTATDADSPAVTWNVANGTGTYGSLSITSAGVWTYNLDNNSAATQALKAGEVKTESFTATVSDGQGGTTTQVITVTVNGTNDAPVVTSAASAAVGSVTEAGVGTAGTATASGTLTATDVDSSSLTWSVPNSGAGTYGSLAINANGAWTYTLDNNSAATQALKAGESKTETFTATVSDGAGGTATQVITVTVNGTNDAPVVSGTSVVSGSVTEAGINASGGAVAGTATATGTLVATDVDSSSLTWTVPNNGAGTYGSLTLNANGAWTYNLNNSSAATQALKAGEVKTETFTATVSDGAGGTATQVITVTVNGTNDAPVITSAASAAVGSVTEAGVGTAGTATASGTLTATDVDSSNLTWSVPNSGAGTYGSLSINANGVWTYTLDNNSAATQALKAGESKTESFTATVSDGAGGTATQVITVTVNGTNDAPVVTSNAAAATGSVTEAGVTPAGAATAGTASATGTLTATDADSPSTTWSVANGTGTYGSLSITSAGVWTYNLDNSSSATQALKAGESKTETFTATVSDGQGGTATQVITVTVNGTNDAPVVTSNAAAAAGSVTEAGVTPAGAATAGTASATGTLTATDVDSTSLSWSVPNSGAGIYGSLSISSAGVWTYTLNNNSAATQALKAGDVKTETFTATVSDGAGGTATQVITVTVNGTNDAPVITSAASAAAGSVTEAGVGTAGTATATGTLTATDVDSTSLSWSVPNSGAGTYGSLSINSAGVWTYTLNNSSAATQALKAGDVKTETFTATVSDGAGGTATQVITVTVNGTNDAPVVTSSAAAATGSVTEAGINAAGATVAGTASTGGTLTATDVDSPSTSWSVANGTGTYGSLSITSAGVWTYNLDNSSSATQALKAGESKTETFTATVSDGQGGTATQVITVTVNGTNDAPVVTSNAAAATGSVTEAGLTPTGVATNGTPSATGTLTASDVDTSTTTWSVANGTGTYGSLTISSAGVWTYNLDNSKAATQALGAGDVKTETFTATVSDGLGGTATQVITVTVNGTNDAPVAVNDTYSLGLTGQYYGYAQGSGANLESISQVETLIAGKTPDATFTATSLNYSGVSTDLGAGTNLQTFLGSDAASLSTDPATTSDAIIKLSGQVTLAAGTYTFKVTSDDGFILRIDGQDVVKFDGNRSSAATTANYTIATGGAHQIEIIYWDQGGNAVLKVETKVAGTADSSYTVLGASGNTSTLVTAEDTALTINASTLLKNDSDVDGGTLTLTSVQNASHGTVSLSNGVITFNPDANYNGEATFQYTVSDGKGGTASATVTLYVTPVNDAPVVSATPVALSGDEDTAIIITKAQLLGNVTDVDGDTLTISNLTKTSGQGTLVANSDGTWTFTPTKDWNGDVKFSYTVSDGSVSVSDSATLTVKPVADAVADTGVTNEDTPVTLNVLGNDTFSNTATITSINGTAISNNGSVAVDHGTVKLVSGQLVFTPDANYHGQSNFTYTVTSGGVTETAGVKLMINSVSDATTPTISVTPKGFWTFDSTTGSGNNVRVSNVTTGQTGTLKDIDSTGNSSIPTLSTGTGSGTRADGAGKYLTLNSGNDIGDIVQVSTSVTDALMGTATLTFWINTTQTGNSTGSSWNNPSIIGSEDVGGGNDIQWGAITSTGKIGLGLGNTNGVYSTTSINDGAWHNIAISRDASSGLVNVYVDGKLEASGSPTDAAFTGALNKLLEIGATNAFDSNGDVTDSNYYKGALDDLRIYSGVLTADQVAAINHVENGYQNTAIANAHTTAQNTLSLSVTDTASTLTVSGLEAGMIISDGTAGHTITATGVDQVIDISSWTISSLTLGNTGTSSATLIFTGTNTHAGTGDVSATYEALTLANGTSILATGGTGADTLNGSSAADLLRGGDGNDILYGGAGNDRLEGGNGNDTLYGGAGNDLLIGGAGNDLLFGGSGNNIMTGGSGADTFAWQAGDTGKSIITDFNAVEGDRISLGDLLPDINDTNVLSYLKVDTATSTIQISTSGHIDQGADVTITLQGVDLTTYGANSSEIVKSLVAGSDPVVKTDHH